MGFLYIEGEEHRKVAKEYYPDGKILGKIFYNRLGEERSMELYYPNGNKWINIIIDEMHRSSVVAYSESS